VIRKVKVTSRNTKISGKISTIDVLTSTSGTTGSHSRPTVCSTIEYEQRNHGNGQRTWIPDQVENPTTIFSKGVITSAGWTSKEHFRSITSEDTETAPKIPN
jgi:hypothetical protein